MRTALIKLALWILEKTDTGREPRAWFLTGEAGGESQWVELRDGRLYQTNSVYLF